VEKCCFLLSASESYQNASVDLATLTGVKVGHSSQHRQVQRQEFSYPQAKLAIAQVSIDGGKVRLRTELGLPCEWRDFDILTALKTAVSMSIWRFLPRYSNRLGGCYMSSFLTSSKSESVGCASAHLTATKIILIFEPNSHALQRQTEDARSRQQVRKHCAQLQTQQQPALFRPMKF
jgi:hypothetical protein